MRIAAGSLLIALATIACNAIVGYGDLSKQPSGDAGKNTGGDDDSDDDDDDDRDGGGSTGSGEAGPPAACNPTADFGTPVPLAGPVNSASFENSPSLTDDELLLVFQRSLNENKAILMLATRKTTKDAFGEPTALALTGSDLSFQPTITRDGLTLYWAEISDVNKGMDIFTAARTTVTGQFTHAVSTGLANQSVSEQSPIVTDDGNEMFFISDQSGPGITTEIWRSTRVEAEFKNPQKATDLAGDGDDKGIAISKDGLTIFFGSTRTGSTGKLDIFTAHRNTRSETFGTATVVTKLNSPSIDYPTFVSADGCRLYMGSDRANAGDLYVATRGQ